MIVSAKTQIYYSCMPLVGLKHFVIWYKGSGAFFCPSALNSMAGSPFTWWLGTAWRSRSRNCGCLSFLCFTEYLFLYMKVRRNLLFLLMKSILVRASVCPLPCHYAVWGKQLSLPSMKRYLSSATTLIISCAANAHGSVRKRTAWKAVRKIK